MTKYPGALAAARSCFYLRFELKEGGRRARGGYSLGKDTAHQKLGPATEGHVTGKHSIAEEQCPGVFLLLCSRVNHCIQPKARGLGHTVPRCQPPQKQKNQGSWGNGSGGKMFAM